MYKVRMKRVCSCGYETTDRGNFSKHQKRCKQHEFSTQLQQLQQENAELKSRLAGVAPTAKERLMETIEELKAQFFSKIENVQASFEERMDNMAKRMDNMAAPLPPQSTQKSIIFEDLCMCIISNYLSFVHGTRKT